MCLTGTTYHVSKSVEKGRCKITVDIVPREAVRNNAELFKQILVYIVKR